MALRESLSKEGLLENIATPPNCARITAYSPIPNRP